jgi:hypothetical protein
MLLSECFSFFELVDAHVPDSRFLDTNGCRGGMNGGLARQSSYLRLILEARILSGIGPRFGVDFRECTADTKRGRVAAREVAPLV